MVDQIIRFNHYSVNQIIWSDHYSVNQIIRFDHYSVNQIIWSDHYSVKMVFGRSGFNLDIYIYSESKTWNCVLYGDFYGGKMCFGTQRKSRIKVTASVNNVFIIDVLCDLAPDTFHSPWKYFIYSVFGNY